MLKCKFFVTSTLATMTPVSLMPSAAFAQQYPTNFDECYSDCTASRPNSQDWCTAQCNQRFGDRPSPPLNPSPPPGCDTPEGCSPFVEPD